MQIFEIELEKLKLDEQNTNTHNEANINYIKNSLTTFGQQKPIIVRRKDNVIVAGNGTYLAAKDLGWKSIQIVYTDLDEIKSKAYSIADNQIGRTSSFDLEELAASIKDLEKEFNWSIENNWQALGFENSDVDLLLQAGDVFEGDINVNKEVDISEKAKPKTIKLTEDQYDIFKQAADKLREIEGDKSISDGRVIEFISIEYINSL